jgi:hypothetical protein
MLFVEGLSPRVYSDRQDACPILQRCGFRERGRILRGGVAGPILVE